MAEVDLSEAERTYILHGIQDDLRVDGRSCEDYRYMEVETEVVSNTNGSARLRLANTDILVGIKAEIGEPNSDTPDKGRLEFFVDCTANAAPQFEGRGGEELATQIAGMLYRAYDHSECLDLKSLCVVERQQCWVLYVDVLILECGGNLYDAVSIAVKAAIYNTKLPAIRVSCSETGNVELDLPDDPFEVTRIDVSNVPTLVTLNKIGHYHVVDASMEEESCSLARLIIGVTSQGHVTGMIKDGAGSLDPDSIADMVETGKKVGQTVNLTLLKQVKEEEKSGVKTQTVGFLK